MEVQHSSKRRKRGFALPPTPTEDRLARTSDRFLIHCCRPLHHHKENQDIPRNPARDEWLALKNKQRRSRALIPCLLTRGIPSWRPLDWTRASLRSPTDDSLHSRQAHSHSFKAAAEFVLCRRWNQSTCIRRLWGLNSLLLGRESNALRWRVEEIAPYVYFSSIRSQAKPPRSFTVQFGFRSLASARHPSNEHRLVVLAFLATSFTIHWFADLSDSFPTSIQEAISVTHEKSKSYQNSCSNPMKISQHQETILIGSLV